MSDASAGGATPVEHPEEAYLRKQFKLLLYRLDQLPETSRAQVQGHFAQVLLERRIVVDTPHGPLSFVTLGRSSAVRGLTMFTKQPHTIAWIDGFAPDSVFWDVGANVGVYTLYAALRGDTRVVAVEPAAVNYFLLAANCELNKVDTRVTCLLAGLGEDRAVAALEASQFAPAQSFSFRGKKHKPYAARQAALMASMDQLIEDYALPCPNYIKVDVPGLTAAILAGATRTLRRPEVRELHVEASEESTGGRRVMEIMAASGFALAGKSSHGSTDLTFVKAGR